MKSNIKDDIVSIRATLKAATKNEEILQSVDFLTFIISLIPIPGVEQVGQIANKIVSEQALKSKFFEIREQILSTNERINDLESELERIGEIAKTTSSVTKIQSLIDQFIALLTKALNQEDSEFVVETTNWSVQTIINQIIEVDWVSVSAMHFSENILRHTKIKARKTHLRAHDHSINIIDGTEFGNHEGSVKMQDIGQTGDIQVSGSSVDFTAGSSLIFGVRPVTVKGNCPRCRYLLEIEEYSLKGSSNIQCPNCSQIMPFTIT